MDVQELIRKSRNWLPIDQSRLESTATDIEVRLTEADFILLSPAAIAEIQSRLERLLTPTTYRQKIQSALSTALSQWLDQKESQKNSLVIRYNPIEKVEKIFHEAVTAWIPSHSIHTQFLQWPGRLSDDSALQPMLEEQIESIQSSIADISESAIIVVPNLSLLFLRCVEGFAGIEYLQNQISQDQSKFWLIGCNEWLWQYLDHVCSLAIYSEQTEFLSGLDSFVLIEWLDHVCELVDFEFDTKSKSSSDSKEDEDDSEDWISKAERKYFDGLTSISAGYSSIAARLWLYSLHLSQPRKKSEDKEAEQQYLEEIESDKKLLTLRAKLPELPSLTKDDNFLLYSLCLHERMSLSNLAISLGESDYQIKSQVQVLLRNHLIEGNYDSLQLNPAHYPRLRRNLKDNHFLVGEEN
ncbi:MAG: hypothetical protein ACFBSC_01885 [Microcoleaceae cyanobacterium]